jgi:hypothetical protein
MLGMMMLKGKAFDQNEQTRAEGFRLITISATLLHGRVNPAAAVLARFFRDSPPVMLHYLRPAVEEGDTGVMDDYARGLLQLNAEYYEKKAYLTPGYSPVPELLFWYRQCGKKGEPLERTIRENCAHCEADLPEGKQSCCVECKAAYYCNRDCQVAHWKAGHKKDCVKKLKKRLRAANGAH